MGTMSRLKNRPNRKATVTFPFDPSDFDLYEELDVKLRQAKAHVEQLEQFALAGPDDVRRLEQSRQAVTDAQSALDMFLTTIPTIRWRFESCGHKRAEALKFEHPPTAEQIAQFEAEQAAAGQRGNFLSFNRDTFAPALIAACCTAIEIDHEEAKERPTVEEVAEILDGDSWSEKDKAELMGTCLILTQVNTSISRDQLASVGKG